MSLMDIADLEPMLRAVHHVLKPMGWFVYATLHPCFHTSRSGELETADGGLVRTAANYFVEGHWRSDARTGPPGKVGAYHRMLSTYVNALLDHGFTLERIAESAATDSLTARRPVWSEVPGALAARWRARS